MAAEGSRLSSDAARKRKQEFERLSEDVTNSCDVLTNWVKNNYDDAEALRHLKELSNALAKEFSRIPPLIKEEAGKIQDEKVKTKLKNIAESFERHGSELRTSVKSAGTGVEDIMLSVNSCMLEAKLVEKCLRSNETPPAQKIKDFVINCLKSIISTIGRAEKCDIEKLKKEREPEKKKPISKSDEDSDDEKSEGPKNDDDDDDDDD